MQPSPIQLKTDIDLEHAQARSIAPVLFELITKDLGASLIITDVQGRVVWVNQSFVLLTGYSLNDMRGRKPGDVLQGKQTSAATRALMRAALDRQDGFEAEVLNYRPDGIAYWIFLSVRPLLNANGECSGYLATQANVSERRKAQGALAECEALLRSLGDHLPEGCIYQLEVDPAGKVAYRYVSEGVEALCGLSSADILAGRADPFKQHHPDDRARLRDALRTSICHLAVFDYQGRRILPSGEVRWSHFRAAPTPQADGSLIWNGVLLDITERKQAEAERDASVLKLEAQNAELTDFTYTVSHDLRSPLVTIRGFCGMARLAIQRGTSEQALGHLDRVDRASARMVELLNDLLELSRVGRVSDIGARAPLNGLIDDVLNSLDAEIQSSKAEIAVSPNLPSVFGDLSRIKQVLANLLSNAIKFSQPGRSPKIEVGGRRDGPLIEFFVADQGRGIAPEFQFKLFGLFERLHPDVEGTGIGLALVKRIVDLHQGQVRVESKGEGQGARFVVRLPL